MLYGLGFVFLLGGSGMILWGSLLPWLTLKVFGLPVLLPGVVGLGSVTAVLGLSALTRTRPFPLMNLLLGLICTVVGIQAQQVIGRTTARQILTVQQQLAPINAHLEQVNLPPIEPFSDSVIARNYVGPGPTWVVWGGIALATAGLLQFAGSRLERTCAYCHTFWRAGREIYFCPRCGKAARIASRCERCFTPLQRHDRFCTNCGMAGTRQNTGIAGT
jgi:hypothetical protein